MAELSKTQRGGWYEPLSEEKMSERKRTSLAIDIALSQEPRQRSAVCDGQEVHDPCSFILAAEREPTKNASQVAGALGLHITQSTDFFY